MPRTTERRPAQGSRPPLEIVRSTHRRRSASAYSRDGVIVVQLPARLPDTEEERLIAHLVDKVTRQHQVEAAGGDAELAARAARLADEYLDGVRARSVRWSGRMRRRYGSCTPTEGTIRISREVAAFPDYVLDYLLVHELAHLVEPHHSEAFHALVGRFPDTPRARAFLDGVAIGQARAGIAPEDDGAPAALDGPA